GWGGGGRGGGWGGGRARSRGAGRGRGRRMLPIEPHPHAPLLMVGDALDHRRDVLSIGPYVIENALVAHKDREQLHRQHGSLADERFDNGLVRDGRARHPLEIRETAADGCLAELVERSVCADGKQTGLDV